MTNSFYVILTSHARRDQYPGNKPAEFTMQLTSQLHLSEVLGSGHDAYDLPILLAELVRTLSLFHVALQDRPCPMDINHLSTERYSPHIRSNT